MGLFNNEAVQDYKTKGYSLVCYGETSSTPHMSQFALFYRIEYKVKMENLKKFEGFCFELINDDLYQKSLIPLSIKTLVNEATIKSFQVIVKRV